MCVTFFFFFLLLDLRVLKRLSGSQVLMLIIYAGCGEMDGLRRRASRDRSLCFAGFQTADMGIEGVSCVIR